MQPSFTTNKVVENVEIEKNIFRLIVQGDFNVRPGQFYNLRAWDNEPVLSRPISINDAEDNTITFLYEVRGTGTKLISRLEPGDNIELLGPLGNFFDLEAVSGKVALVTGGIGIAPLLYTVKKFKNVNFDLYAGFREKSYLGDEFNPHVDNIYIATDSGSEGHKGFITEIFDPKNYNLVLCCGPEMMMKKVVTMCSDAEVPVLVSMESHMACGIGACLVCTCKTKSGMKRTCKDGPIFDGRDVI